MSVVLVTGSRDAVEMLIEEISTELHEVLGDDLEHFDLGHATHCLATAFVYATSRPTDAHRVFMLSEVPTEEPRTVALLTELATTSVTIYVSWPETSIPAELIDLCDRVDAQQVRTRH